MTAVENRKARFDYEILETFTAGLELQGPEVKAVRAGRISLSGSFIIVRGGEVFLQGAKIEAYQPNNLTAVHKPDRIKKLLLSKKEIVELEKAEGSRGLTIVPIKVYNKGRFLKIDIAVVRGKKKFDKRETIKKRDVERDLNRSL